MSRKKKEVESVESVTDIVEQPVKEQSASQEPIFLRETIFSLDEIKKYNLNQYFLRAILKDKYYTLSEAHRLIKAAL